MGPDADAWPSTVEPHAAFYGLWPRFADPVGKGAAVTPLRERPTRHVCALVNLAGATGDANVIGR
jgi:hypothetical protein